MARSRKFLGILGEHHDFSKEKRNCKSEQRVIVQTPSHRRSTINAPTVTAVRDYQPAFIEGELDSISVHLRKSRGHFNPPAANLNTSAFGHSTQNSSSHALRELFGVRQSTDQTRPTADRGNDTPRNTVGIGPEFPSGDNESDHSHSLKLNQTRNLHRQGGGDPGDSNGDDSDDGGKGNNPCGGPRKASSPKNPRKHNHFDQNPEEVSSSISKTPPEPQFDTKLKLDVIPTWDGNPEALRRWFLKINSLAKRSSVVFKQLGTLVPTQLTRSAEVWYYSQSVEIRDRIEQDWSTLCSVIGEYYMNCAFLDKQKVC